MRRLFITLIISIPVIFSLRAEENVTVLTLDQCIEMALQHSSESAIARNNVTAAVELRKEAFTKYFPEISATGMAFWANRDMLQYNLLDMIELGIIKKGRVAAVEAMQPIFVGGQIVNGNKLAEVGEEVARLRRTQTDDQLRLTTETLYWKLATLKATRRTLESALATLDTLDNQVQVAVEAGMTTLNDKLKVQLKRNTYRAEMVDLDNGILLVKMLLGQYVGLGTEGNIDIKADVPAEVPALPFDLFIPAETALPNTTDYQLLTRNIEAKKLEKRIEIGKNLPSVAFGAGWFYHNLLEQNHNFGAILIGVNVPITAWWGGSHSIKRKSLELENAKLQFNDLSQKLQIEMQDKWNNFTAAHRKMEIEAEGIQQSAENLRLNKMYYEAGISTITDLLEAETTFKQATDAYIAAYGAFCVARAAYLISTAQTL